jgi:hypothetical protein
LNESEQVYSTNLRLISTNPIVLSIIQTKAGKTCLGLLVQGVFELSPEFIEKKGALVD